MSNRMTFISGNLCLLVLVIVAVVGLFGFTEYRIWRLEQVYTKQIGDLQGQLQDSDHLLLTATMLNENIAAIQKGDADSITFINKDWTIDRMPHYVEMDDTQRTRIAKMVKTQN